MFRLNADGTTIEMIRGNTGTLRIRLTGYTFGNNDRVLFSMRNPGGTEVKSEICEVDENGWIEVEFVNSDTDYLRKGDYTYAVTAVTDPEYDAGGKMIDGSGVDTPVEINNKIIRIYDTAARV